MKTTVKRKSKTEVCELLWLTYFNDVLYTRGLITDDQRNRMRTKINTRTSADRKCVTYSSFHA